MFEINWDEHYLLRHASHWAIWHFISDYYFWTLGAYVCRFCARKSLVPFYCVAANCTNKASLNDGISLDTIPYFNDERAEAKRRRKVWVDFISAERLFVVCTVEDLWSKTSTICSHHFTPEDYERRFFALPWLTKTNYP